MDLLLLSLILVSELLFLIQVILIFAMLGFIPIFLKRHNIQMHVTVHQLCQSMCSEHMCSLSISGIWEEAAVDLSGTALS